MKDSTPFRKARDLALGLSLPLLLGPLVLSFLQPPNDPLPSEYATLLTLEIFAGVAALVLAASTHIVVLFARRHAIKQRLVPPTQPTTARSTEQH